MKYDEGKWSEWSEYAMIGSENSETGNSVNITTDIWDCCQLWGIWWELGTH